MFDHFLGCCIVRAIVYEVDRNLPGFIFVWCVDFLFLISMMKLICYLGLGELTFLQLSTTYTPPSVGGHGIGFVVCR